MLLRWGLLRSNLRFCKLPALCGFFLRKIHREQVLFWTDLQSALRYLQLSCSDGGGVLPAELRYIVTDVNLP